MALLVLGIALLLLVVSVRLMRGRDLPVYAQTLLRGKAHYLCAGILLGVGFSSDLEGTHVLQHAQISLMSLLILWLGLELGIQMEFRMLKKIPARLLIFGAAQSAVTFLLTLTITVFFLPRLARHLLEGADPFVLASMLSVAASVTAPWAQEPPRHPPVAPETDAYPPPHIPGNAVSILLFGCISTLLIDHPPISIANRVFFQSTDALFLSAAIGAGTGILLDTALRVEPAPVKAGYLTVALTAAAGGLCVALDLPALFVGLLAGGWLMNVTLRRRDVQTFSERIHPVMESLFLLVAGSMIGVRTSDSPLNVQGMASLAMLLFVSRAIARTLGVGLLWRLLGPSSADRPFAGTWLLPQGSLAIAVCVQPLFVAWEGPMQAVTIIGGTAIAVALSQAVVSTFPRSSA
ncbi:MAG: hypothetical protein A3F84_25385 [Candidatus Handelsmanbacteria bacterium RIFCSPLOWO2_12_FULL_64_10]|uniref:Cation/H+ exchanger domain-containing protein n=1 Tax=Handelsmanbacteria sp. (strain RIFCSPLOWO2_12_FULL_64_10) TaxID=1817868 RepID=A0A1F6C9L4_HANXR|nr:MAG: hypothetical protein A3F84_25385 [Candidatus Handelsmanbacteria bacterium RIFCSPLOWO2_12_FULL_64_10]